jgi:hypothetical protein
LLDGGSLNPIWPVLPIPKICKSIPPDAMIFFSYYSQKFYTYDFGIFPTGMLIFSYGISIFENKVLFINS